MLSPGDISKITKEVDQDDLVVAMKNASPNSRKSFIPRVQACGRSMEEQ